MPAQRDFTIPVDGVPLAARLLNPADCEGVPLVLLHEGLGCTAMWEDFPARLSARLRRPVLLYDRLGHGASPPLDGERPDAFMEDEAWRVLPQVLAHQGIETPDMLGHSDGGSIALLYAARHQVGRVMTVSAHVCTDKLSRSGVDKTLYLIGDGRMEAALAPGHGAKWGHLAEAWVRHWRGAAERGWDIRPLLPGVTAPVLAVQGETDAYGLPQQLADIAAGVAGPVETLILDGIGHWPHREAPETLLELAAAFFAARVGA